MDWQDFKLLLAIGAGIVLSVLLSTAVGLKARLVCVCSGLFFAAFGTEPLIYWAGIDFTLWKYFIAGCLAMTGDRIARRLLSSVDTANLPTWRRDK